MAEYQELIRRMISIETKLASIDEKLDGVVTLHERVSNLGERLDEEISSTRRVLNGNGQPGVIADIAEIKASRRLSNWILGVMGSGIVAMLCERAAKYLR